MMLVPVARCEAAPARNRGPHSWRAALGLVVCLLGVVCCASCVVTPYEGPSEPPRVAPKPMPQPEIDPRAASRQAPATSAEPAEIEASHILVSFVGATQAAPHVTRTKQEALDRAREALSKARAGSQFPELVKEYSDEPGAAARNGELGRFSRKAVVKEFGDAAFRLKPGELSDIVETPFGYHVILRTK